MVESKETSKQEESKEIQQTKEGKSTEPKLSRIELDLKELDSKLSFSEQFLVRLYSSCKKENLEDDEIRDLFKDVTLLLKYIIRNAKPLRFKKGLANEGVLTNVVYGECGSGKSTL